MQDKVSIRLCLYTQFGPVGKRLERGDPLPIDTIDFEYTEAGLKAAKEARDLMNKYIEKHSEKSKGKK